MRLVTQAGYEGDTKDQVHTLAADVVKADTKKYRTVELWTRCAEVVEKRDTLRKSVSRLNIPHTH